MNVEIGAENVASKAQRAMLHELSVASQILYMEGQNDINHGQISARIPGEDHFWLRGAALGFDEVTESDFIHVDNGGRIVSGKRHRPPEWPIHTQMYKSRSDVNAIVHTHAPSAVVFSALGQELLALSHDACPFWGRLRTFDQTTNTILTIDIADAMVSVLKDDHAVLLKNHGIVVVGSTIKQATILALLLEQACALQLRIPPGLSASGSPPKDIAEKQAFIYSDVAITTYWQYFVRKLERTRNATQLREFRV